jgi:hypothetical protein
MCHIILQRRGALAGAIPAGGNLASQASKIKRYKGLSGMPQVKAKSQRLEVRFESRP